MEILQYIGIIKEILAVIDVGDISKWILSALMVVAGLNHALPPDVVKRLKLDVLQKILTKFQESRAGLTFTKEK